MPQAEHSEASDQAGIDSQSSITLIFGVPRSGTTFLQKKLCLLSQGIGIYEPTNLSAYQGEIDRANPYEDIFLRQHQHIKNNPGAPIIVKEVLDVVMASHLASRGHDLISWVSLSRLENAKIIWIFRNPVEVWRSIVAQGWEKTYHPFEAFISFYADAWSCFKAMKALAPRNTEVISYEQLVASEEQSLKKAAEFAGLPISPEWQNAELDQEAYYQKVYYDPTTKAVMEAYDAHSSLHRGLAAAKPKPAIQVSDNLKIQQLLKPIYEQVLRQDLLA